MQRFHHMIRGWVIDRRNRRAIAHLNDHERKDIGLPPRTNPPKHPTLW